MDMKRFFLYAIVIAALALAGCGGNGGGTTTVDPTPTPMPTSIDLSKLLAGYMDLGADGEHTIKAGESEPIGDGQFMCAAGGADCTVTVKDGKATYMSDSPMVTATGPSQAAQDAKADADKAMVAMTQGMAKAITTPTGQTVANSAAVNGLPKEFTVKRSTTGVTTVEFKNQDADDNDTVVDDFDPKYTIATDAPPAITGWTGQTYTRDNTNSTDSVTIYTNIANAKPEKLEYDDVDGDVDNIPLVASPNEDTSPSDRTSNVVFDDDKLSYAQKDTVSGSVNGVNGTFTCGAANCSVTFLDKTELAQGVSETAVASLSSGNWKFKSTEYIEELATQDSNYLYFGYWLESPNTGNTYAFNTFYGGATPYGAGATDATTFNALRGASPTTGAVSGDSPVAGPAWTRAQSMATYEGPAAGRYVQNAVSVVDGALKSTVAKVGQFTADASMTAYFGVSDEVPSKMQNTLSGTIRNFMDGNTKLGFDLVFDAVKFADSTYTYGGDVSGLDGTVRSRSGTWTAELYNPKSESFPHRSGYTGTEDKKSYTIPQGIAGSFDADFTTGHVAGGFAATKK